MDISSVINNLKENFTNELQAKIKATDIPLCTSEKDEDRCITIFVIQSKPNFKFLNASTHKSKNKSKNCKSSTNAIQICYSCDLEFDIRKLEKRPISLQLIYMILKPECYQTSVNKISNWSRTIFRTISSLYEDSDFCLCQIPFEVYFDENDNLYLSRLPEFTDLLFFDPYNSTKVVKATNFLENQAAAIINTENFQQSRKLQSTASSSTPVESNTPSTK